MQAHKDQLCRREFLTKATQTTVAVAASAGIGSPLASLFARAAEASHSRASRMRCGPRSSCPARSRITATRWTGSLRLPKPVCVPAENRRKQVEKRIRNE